MEWVPRTIVDAEYENPYRYQLKDISTGAVISTYDIVPTWKDNQSEVIQNGTEINAAYLQPIEDFLKAVGDDLLALGVELSRIDTNLSQSQSTLSGRITSTESALSTKIFQTESSLNTKIEKVESDTNAKITSANQRLDDTNTQITSVDERIKAIDLSSFAPKEYPVLVGPRGDVPSQSDRSTRLATTSWVYEYVNRLLNSI